MKPIYAIVIDGKTSSLHQNKDYAIAETLRMMCKRVDNLINAVEEGDELDWYAWNLVDYFITARYFNFYLGELDFNSDGDLQGCNGYFAICNDIDVRDLPEVKQYLFLRQSEYRANHKEPAPYKDYHTI